MIEEEFSQGILTLTLNRPEKRNALTVPMMDALRNHIRRAGENPEVRCLLPLGSGKSFCAGRDLGALLERSDLEYLLHFDGSYTEIFQAMRRIPKPVVAGVHGYAVGGGFSLAMGCDFLVAHAGAQFGCLEMKQGFPAAINIALLAHHLGRRKALEIAMTGELVPARSLHSLGLVNLLAEGAEDDLPKAAREYALKLAALDPVSVAWTKETFLAVESAHIEDALITGKHLNLLLASSGKINEGAKRFSK